MPKVCCLVVRKRNIEAVLEFESRTLKPTVVFRSVCNG